MIHTRVFASFGMKESLLVTIVTANDSSPGAASSMRFRTQMTPHLSNVVSMPRAIDFAGMRSRADEKFMTLVFESIHDGLM